jgi:hypothetical protein
VARLREQFAGHSADRRVRVEEPVGVKGGQLWRGIGDGGGQEAFLPRGAWNTNVRSTN